MAKQAAMSERRMATRKRLIDAALEVVAKDGFDGASVDAIAGRAGFSVGALYSNFASKDELFFAVFDAHLGWYEVKLTEAAAVADLAEGVADWFRAFEHEREQFLVFVEFWAYAVRSRKLRPQLAKRMGAMREHLAEALRARADEAGAELAFSAERLALLIGALSRGLILEKLADPGVISDDEVGELLASLAV